MKNENINTGNQRSGNLEPRVARRYEKTDHFVNTWKSEKTLLSGEELPEEMFEDLCPWSPPAPKLLEDTEKENEETPFGLRKRRSGETQDYYFENK